MAQARRKLDLLVVMDTAMTGSADLAHIVLPAVTFLGTTELHSYGGSGLPDVILRQKAAEFPECWPDCKLRFTLAKRVIWRDEFIVASITGSGFKAREAVDDIVQPAIEFPQEALAWRWLRWSHGSAAFAQTPAA